MNNYSIVDKMIDYIEHNLDEKITIEHLLKEFHYSSAHLYRLFSGVIGVSPMKYFKRRKLSEAARMIVETRKSITHVCFEYGFESQEVFARAFKKEFGCSASLLRKGRKFRYYHKFDVSKVILENERIRTMNVEIITIDAFSLSGIEVLLNQKEQVENNSIDKILSKFYSTHQVKNKVFSVYEYDKEILNQADELINYKYFVGCKGLEAEISKDIPKSKYAKFIYNKVDRTINNQLLSNFTLDGEPVEDVYDYIDGVWLPSSSYELSDNYDFEIRDSLDQDVIAYYISIK